jgi:hypothetical protein
MAGELELEETTVERLGGVRVGIANIYEGDYERADGSADRGPTATLIPLLGQDPNPQLVVGAGSALTLGSERFEVVDVSPGDGEHGTVTVRPLPG